MQFVQFGMLGALSALAIPIIIHLMFRRQARTVDLGTLQFLKVVVSTNAKKRRLKRYLLLALRLGCVGLLAILFARPFLLAEVPRGDGRLVVVLVDRSASMGLVGGPRPGDRALAEVRSIVARAEADMKIEIATFDRVVTPLTKLDEVEKSVTAPSAAGTDYDAALAWARDLCVRSKAKSKTITILTDLQRAGLGQGEAPKIPSEITVNLIDLGRAFPKNLAVTGLSVSPTSPRPRESVVITTKVRNTAPLPVEKVAVRLQLAAKGSTPIALEQTIDLDGDASETLEFKLPEIGEGLWSGSIEANLSDDLPFDNRRYLAFGVTPPAKILLVDGDPGRSALEAETYFVQAALRLAADGESYDKAPYDPRSIDLFEARNGWPTLDKTAAVVLANVADLPTDDARKLAEYVKNGGGLVVFTGDRVTAESSATLIEAGLGVGQVIGPESSTGRPWRLDRWVEKHPLVRSFADPEHGDLRRPAFYAITKIIPDLSTEVVARFRGGEPALLARSVGLGKIVWFASSCDRAWNDWPRGRMFLPMVHQMISYASGQADGGPIRPEIAEADRLPGLVESGPILKVINADPFESETARCSRQEFAARYGFRLPEIKAVAASAERVGKPADDRLRGDEIWPWIALTLMGLLMFEQFLANRTAA